MGDKLRIYDKDGIEIKFDPIDAAGTISFTGDQDMGGYLITGLKDASAAKDAFCVPTSPTKGDIFYWNGTTLVSLAIGTQGQKLKMNGTATTIEWV